MIWYALGTTVLIGIFGPYLLGLLTLPGNGLVFLGIYLTTKYEDWKGLNSVMWGLTIINGVWIVIVMSCWAAYCVWQYNYFASDPSVQYRWIYQSIGFFACYGPLAIMTADDLPRSDYLMNRIAKVTLVIAYIGLTIVGRAYFVNETRSVVSDESWPEAALDEVRHFTLTLDEYRTMKPRDEASDQNTDEWVKDCSEILVNIQRHSEQVSDSILGRIHSELPAHYRNEFMRGVEVGIYGFDHGDFDSFEVARQSFELWGAWYNDHYQEFGSF